MREAARASGGYPPLDAYGLRSNYITVRDGTRLAIDLYGTDPASPKPLILIATQYRRRIAATPGREGQLATMVNHVAPVRRLAAAGYAVAILDVRGTGASFGTKNGYDTPLTRTEDYADVLAWLGAQDWCDGNIGMYGYSFVGATQMASAMSGSPFLKCIVPQQATGSSFRGYMNVNGVQNTAFRERVDVLMRRIAIDEPALPVDEDEDGALLAQAIEEHRRMKPSGPVLLERRFADDPTAGRPDNGLHLRWPEIARSGVAIMHVGGWRDLFPDETLRLYETWRETNPSVLYFGPWVHGSQERDVPENEDFFEAMTAFYDRHLRLGSGSPRPAPVTWAVLQPGGETLWRKAEAWPPPVDEHRLWLAGGELAALPPSGGEPARLAVDPEATTSGLATRYTMDWGEESRARLEADALCFTSAPFERAMELTGAPVVSLEVSCNGPDADLFIHLHHVDAQGFSRPLTESALRLSNRAEGPSTYPTLGLPFHPTRRGDQRPMPEDGSPVLVRVALLQTAARIEAGARLRLAITGADKGNWETPAREGAAIAIHPGPGSLLTLPILREG